ncbi:MAG TPA: pitrilysin family protein [Vicinamibacterales bacterium]|nr:pitrilysin family protein [Vicinamibacterales bacterium]
MNARKSAIVVVASLAASTMLIAATPAGEQGGAPPQSSKAVVMKGRAPVSTEMLHIKLPRPVETDLPNGLHLMVLEDRRAPQVSFQIIIPGAGGYFDPAEMPGVSSMTAAMMREGTTSKTTQQIAEMLETMAANVNVGGSLSGVTATISGSSLTENFDATFGLAADILLNPTFPKDEFDRYKSRTAAGLVQQRSNPSFLANEMFARMVYGAHPAARVAMNADVLKAATTETLAAFHKSHYVPDHALLAIAGDISMADARKLADAKLAAWKKAGTPAPTVQDPPAIGPARVSLIARPNSVQTSLWVGTQGISRTSPDFDIVTVMDKVIGGGPTGRLFVHLREEKGYTYGAYSQMSTGQYRGSWLASTDVRTEVTEPALKDLMAEIARMRDEPVPTKEFEDAKRSLVASFALSLESPTAVLSNHVSRWLYKLPVDYWDKLPERISAVTVAQVEAAAKKYLEPTRLQIVAVGDEAKVGPVLKQFGTVDVYDTNGVKK